MDELIIYPPFSSVLFYFILFYVILSYGGGNPLLPVPQSTEKDCLDMVNYSRKFKIGFAVTGESFVSFCLWCYYTPGLEEFLFSFLFFFFSF